MTRERTLRLSETKPYNGVSYRRNVKTERVLDVMTEERVTSLHCIERSERRRRNESVSERESKREEVIGICITSERRERVQRRKGLSNKGENNAAIPLPSGASNEERRSKAILLAPNL